MPWPVGLRAFRHRDYRLFWIGQLVSLSGTWMQRVGQAWLVLELTNSPFKLGLISTLQYTPILVFSFVAGAIADRVRKRRLIVGTQAALMVQAFILAALVESGQVRYWHVAVLATLQGLASTLDIPARQSFVTDVVGRSDVMSAVALNSAVFNSARAVGPAIAGLLVARYGVAIAFLLNGVSFIAVLIALLLIRTEGAPRPREDSTMLEEILDGARYASGTPLVALVLGMILTVSVFVINFNTLVPLIARDVLHEGAHAFGFLMGSLGLGALIGALALALGGPGRPAVSVLITGAVVLSGMTTALGAVNDFSVAAGALLIIGAAQIIFTAGCNTTLQITAPDQLRGRVMSLYALVFAGASPFGSLLVGYVAEKLGVQAACAIGGAAGLVLIALLAVAWRRVARRPHSLPGAAA